MEPTGTLNQLNILEPTWNKFFKLNPHTIRSVNTLTDTYLLEAGDGFIFPGHSFKIPYKLPNELFEI